MQISVTLVGIVLGVALLVSSGMRAYADSGASVLGYLRLATQATMGACLVFYFSLGKLKPIDFAKTDIGARELFHARPGFAKVGRNPVLAKYYRR